MEKTTIVYKVVTPDMRSFMEHILGRAAIKYKVGKWISPTVKGSKIYCFKSKQQTKNLSLMGGRIFKGVAKNVSNGQVKYLLPQDVERIALNVLRKFWQRGVISGGMMVHTRRCLLCSSIKLLKEIK